MDYKSFAIDLAKKAGKTIRANFRLAMKKDWKDNDTPVTITDTAINRMVINAVKKHFPSHGVLGEEESYNEKGKEFLWVCDPVDGTVPFSHGVPTSTFSLALVKNGKPIVGVAYDPFMDRMFSAELGKGAFLNGRRISVNKRGMHNSVISWESWKSVEALRLKYKTSFPMSWFSFVYGAVLVACGELVAAVYTWNYAHDAAAAKVIVEEAGGIVTDLHGKDQRYDRKINGCLVSNGKVHKELLKILKKFY